MKDSHLIISKRGLLLCFASLSLLCGCTHSELSEEGDDATAPLCIGQARTGGLVTDTDTDDSATTRAEGNLVLNKPDDAIGLFRQEDKKADESVIYTAITNQQYTYGDPSWKPADGTPLQLNKEQATLAAYYPYSIDGPNKVNGEIVATKPLRFQSYSEDAAKFYYKNFNASIFNPSVNLDLRQPYSLLRFSISRDARYVGVGEVTKFEWSAKLTDNGTLDLFTGTMMGLKTDVEKSDKLAKFTIAEAAEPKPYIVEYLVVPSEFKSLISPPARVTIDVTADKKTYTQATVTATELCGRKNTFVEGMVYEIRVTLRPGKLSVQTIDVTPWVSEEVGGKLENK